MAFNQIECNFLISIIPISVNSGQAAAIEARARVQSSSHLKLNLNFVLFACVLKFR